MRFFVTLLLVLVATVAAAVLILQDTGYVLIVYQQWAVETSLIGGLVIIFAALYLLVLLFRLFRNVWLLPQRLRESKKARRRLRAQVGTNRGLLALAEGNWAKAEKLLIRFAKESEMPLINFLGAARAAQKQNASVRRDLHLTDASARQTRRTGRGTPGSMARRARVAPGRVAPRAGRVPTLSLNMTKIESRPSKRKAWEYFFFIDCDGHFQDQKVTKAIALLEQECSYVKVLGSYPNAE